jgi:hypothetical protein
VRHRVLRHQHRPGQVDGEAPVPARERQLLHRRVVRAGEPGVVDQRVQPAEAGEHLAHAGAHRRFAGDVAAHEEEAALAAVKVRHGYLVAQPLQPLGDAEPDAAGPACYKDCF